MNDLIESLGVGTFSIFEIQKTTILITLSNLEALLVYLPNYKKKCQIYTSLPVNGW